MDDAKRGILEQYAAEPTTLMAVGDGQAPEDYDRDRVGHVAPEASRCGRRNHGA
jgi:hypothetical protein